MPQIEITVTADPSDEDPDAVTFEVGLTNMGDEQEATRLLGLVCLMIAAEIRPDAVSSRYGGDVVVHGVHE